MWKDMELGLLASHLGQVMKDSSEVKVMGWEVVTSWHRSNIISPCTWMKGLALRARLMMSRLMLSALYRT